MTGEELPCEPPQLDAGHDLPATMCSEHLPLLNYIQLRRSLPSGWKTFWVWLLISVAIFIWLFVLLLACVIIALAFSYDKVIPPVALLAGFFIVLALFMSWLAFRLRSPSRAPNARWRRLAEECDDPPYR
jgi:hypothetical protein